MVLEGEADPPAAGESSVAEGVDIPALLPRPRPDGLFRVATSRQEGAYLLQPLWHFLVNSFLRQLILLFK